MKTDRSFNMDILSTDIFLKTCSPVRIFTADFISLFIFLYAAGDRCVITEEKDECTLPSILLLYDVCVTCLMQWLFIVKGSVHPICTNRNCSPTVSLVAFCASTPIQCLLDTIV